jgi:multidrug efflux system outer membrane protein
MKKIISFIAVTALSSCSFIPDYKRPAVETPAAFSQTSAPSSIAQDWWKSFASAELNGLMAAALEHNNDLRASVQRIKQAEGLLTRSRASLFPSIDANAAAARTRTTRPDSADTNLNAGISVSYELDLFGANRAELESATYDVVASEFDFEALKLIVMANVAQTYFDVLNARERLRIADVNLKNNREVLRIVEARFQAGATDALDVARQKTQLSSAEAARASVELQRKNAENALAVLVGKAPQSLSLSAQNLTPLSVPAIAPGQPADLLTRRPDIRRAEAQLMAANADIGIVRASFLPSITLSLDGGIIAAALDKAAGTTLSAASGLVTPIFRGGRLQGELKRVNARQLELVENYRKAVLESLRDVEDSLAAVTAAQTRENSLRIAMQEARKSYELSRSQYDAGAIDFQTLLDAQRTLLTSEDAFASSKNERLAAAVSLFKALGGGWKA